MGPLADFALRFWRTILTPLTGLCASRLQECGIPDHTGHTAARKRRFCCHAPGIRSLPPRDPPCTAGGGAIRLSTVIHGVSVVIFFASFLYGQSQSPTAQRGTLSATYNTTEARMGTQPHGQPLITLTHRRKAHGGEVDKPHSPMQSAFLLAMEDALTPHQALWAMTTYVSRNEWCGQRR
jgi:hypothetical protein